MEVLDPVLGWQVSVILDVSVAAWRGGAQQTHS